MNIGDLIDLLAQFPRETPVILAGDAEGNDFYWLDAYGYGYVKEGTTHLYHVYDDDEVKEYTDEAKEYGYEPQKFDQVFVLWP